VVTVGRKRGDPRAPFRPTRRALVPFTVISMPAVHLGSQACHAALYVVTGCRRPSRDAVGCIAGHSRIRVMPAADAWVVFVWLQGNEVEEFDGRMIAQGLWTDGMPRWAAFPVGRCAFGFHPGA
jgi:hypothetical protein